MTNFLRKHLVGVVSLTALVAGFVAERAVEEVVSDLRTAANSSAPADVPPRFPTGPYLFTMVFIPSEEGIQKEGFWNELAGAKTSLRSAYPDSLADVVMVGVFPNSEPDSGPRLVETLSPRDGLMLFDEFSVGGKATNLDLKYFRSRSLAVEPNTPSIQVVRRYVDASSYSATGRLEIGPDLVVAQVTGAEEIKNWLRHGTPLVLPQRGSEGSKEIAARRQQPRIYRGGQFHIHHEEVIMATPKLVSPFKLMFVGVLSGLAGAVVGYGTAPMPVGAEDCVCTMPSLGDYRCPSSSAQGCFSGSWSCDILCE